jgi:hypothetical protein
VTGGIAAFVSFVFCTGLVSETFCIAALPAPFGLTIFFPALSSPSPLSPTAFLFNPIRCCPAAIPVFLLDSSSSDEGLKSQKDRLSSCTDPCFELPAICCTGDFLPVVLADFFRLYVTTLPFCRFWNDILPGFRGRDWWEGV